MFSCDTRIKFLKMISISSDREDEYHEVGIGNSSFFHAHD